MPENNISGLLTYIGSRLYETRRMKNEKIANVARSVHKSSSVISQVENGRYKSLNLQLLTQIANYYGIDIADLLAPPGKQ
jgi:transcriptional regulator with XRE-family HTH domain